MNENLLERFQRGKPGRKGHGGESIQVWLQPQKLNNLVREYYEAQRKPVEAGPWLDRLELPSSAEILDVDGEAGSSSSEIVDLVPNKPKGPWESKEVYLSAHYELLREDALFPLRNAICHVRIHPDQNEEDYNTGSVGIYQDVYITSVVCSTRGIALRVTFSTFRAQKKILWEQSKRLMSGSLVVLTPASDMFRTKAIVATVAARPLAGVNQNPPEVDLFVARADELEIDPGLQMVMVEERSGYFEAERHTLLALQKMRTESFPLAEHLVDVRPAVAAPAYLKEKPTMNMTSVFMNNKHETYENVDTLNAWPARPASELDSSQIAALKRILTKRLAIVQGPPGTGKTYISVQAIKIMLENSKPGDPPIIVTCQTNHALDQLLRHIAKFEPDFIRLGGRSKDRDVIKARTLYEVRNSESTNALTGSVGPGARKKMKDLEKEIGSMLSPFSLENKTALDHRLLQSLGLISEKQADSLEAGASQWVQTKQSGLKQALKSPFFVWLGKLLEVVPPPGVPQEFGFDVEETDLEYEQLKEIEAENFAKDDEEFDQLSGPSYAVVDNFTCRKVSGMTDTKVKALLQKEKDMWKIPEAVRGAIYRYLQAETKKLIRDNFRQKAKVYDAQARQRRIGGWEKDETILRKQKVIGLTTTGFSKYRGLIAALQPKVVLIEEAAETLEAPVAVTCVPSLQQLILVGDHKQLRPHCHVKTHEKSPWHLNISLFERMVENDVEYNTLEKQRRMIPEIRRVLCPIYGDKIKDHGSVSNPINRPNVPGMGGINSFFFNHSWPEDRDDLMSCVNGDEARMIVGFVEYLVYNGTEDKNITVLTFYNGQRKRILSLLRKSPALEHQRFQVVTVDSYQGEENDVVILSLVRSNAKNQIGFLGVDNRVCVALSRAKRGFYIFGNGELLYKCNQAQTWVKVIEIMAGAKRKRDMPLLMPNRLSEALPVYCTNHNKLTLIRDPDDWNKIVGGCEDKCNVKMTCGHVCNLTCHPFPHEVITCQQHCQRVLACGHKCSKLCAESCICHICNKPVPEPTTLSSSTQADASTIEPFDGKERLAPQHSSGSSQSWHSFSNDETARYAAAYSTPIVQRTSPTKAAGSGRLVELKQDGSPLDDMKEMAAELGGAGPSRRATPQKRAGGRLEWQDRVMVTGAEGEEVKGKAVEESLIDL